MVVLIIIILLVILSYVFYMAKALKDKSDDRHSDDAQPKPSIPAQPRVTPRPVVRPSVPRPVAVVANRTEAQQVAKPTVHSTRSHVVLGPCSRNDARILFGRTAGQLKAIAAIQQPMVHEVLWHLKNIETYYLAFPYCVFILGFWNEQLAKIYIYYSNSLVTTPDNRLCMSNLPNVYSDESVCLGHDQQLEDFRRNVTGHNYAVCIGKAVDRFWQLVFNDGMISTRFNPMAEREPRLKTVGEWQRNSMMRRDFILGVKWQEACTVSEALNRYLHTFS